MDENLLQLLNDKKETIQDMQEHIHDTLKYQRNKTLQKYSDVGIKMEDDIIICPPEYVVEFFEKYHLFKKEISSFSEIHEQRLAPGFCQGSLQAHLSGMDKVEVIGPFAFEYPVEIGLWIYKHDDKEDYYGSISIQIVDYIFPGLADELGLNASSGSKEKRTKTRSKDFSFNSINGFSPIDMARKMQSYSKRILEYQK